MKTIVITSGYFNPLHPWHIECFELCKEFWDEVWVIVNNDEQAKAKTGAIFQDQKFRVKVVSSLRVVDHVIVAVDDDASVCESVRVVSCIIRKKYGSDTKIIFGKWWDRFAGNIPEVQVCNELWIEIKDGLWAKIDNSSGYREKVL